MILNEDAQRERKSRVLYAFYSTNIRFNSRLFSPCLVADEVTAHKCTHDVRVSTVEACATLKAVDLIDAPPCVCTSEVTTGANS